MEDTLRQSWRLACIAGRVLAAVAVLACVWPCHAQDADIKDGSDSEAAANVPPPVLMMIYESGKDDGSWYDLTSPLTPTGIMRLGPGSKYPHGIYGNPTPGFAHRIDLDFAVPEEMDLVFVIDFVSQNGSMKNKTEVRVLLNGSFLAHLDLAPANAKRKQEFAVLDVPAERGNNTLTLDMSKHQGWEHCIFDAVRLYEPEQEPEDLAATEDD